MVDVRLDLIEIPFTLFINQCLFSCSLEPLSPLNAILNLIGNMGDQMFKKNVGSHRYQLTS